MKKYRPIYYDTETTGVKSASDRIIELAAYDAEKDLTFCTFINPGMPIPPESTAISNITDDMVKNAPSFKEVAPSFVEFCAGDTILIAHNNDAFDQLFLSAEFTRASLPFPSWKFLDSLKWSRKYRNDLPKHSLQFLREAYGIQSNQAHRALDDVIVLHQVFSRMIDDLPLERVIDLLSTKPATFRMPFGKHAGKPLADVPKDYIRWLIDKGAFDGPENAPLKAEFAKLGLIPV